MTRNILIMSALWYRVTNYSELRYSKRGEGGGGWDFTYWMDRMCDAVKCMGMAFTKKKSAFHIYLGPFSPFPHENYPKNRSRSLVTHCSPLTSWEKSDDSFPKIF